MTKTDAFDQCTRAKLEKWFGLRRTWDSAVLDQWLYATSSLSESEKITLLTFQEELIPIHDTLNEQELSMSFIGPVLTLARFVEPYRFKLLCRT